MPLADHPRLDEARNLLTRTITHLRGEAGEAETVDGHELLCEAADEAEHALAILDEAVEAEDAG